MDARPGSSITTYRTARLSAWPVLHTIIVALALVGPYAVVHAQAQADAAAPDTTKISSEQSQPGDFRFDLDKLELNVYGFAYHPDREKVEREHLDNEFNPGLGLHYEFRDTERGVTFVELGTYFDSGSNWAKFLSLGYQFKLGESGRVGGAVAAVHSSTYNDGVAFVGMFPLVSYAIGPVKLNAVYFPKVANYNEVAAYGFYVSIPLGRWVGDLAQK